MNQRDNCLRQGRESMAAHHKEKTDVIKDLTSLCKVQQTKLAKSMGTSILGLHRFLELCPDAILPIRQMRWNYATGQRGNLRCFHCGWVHTTDSCNFQRELGITIAKARGMSQSEFDDKINATKSTWEKLMKKREVQP